MTEAVANGTDGAHDASQTGLDLSATKAALSSSSTKVRISQLRVINDKLNSKSECANVTWC